VHVELLRDKEKVFPGNLDPGAVTSLQVWHCKYKSLAPIQKLVGLQKLVIATYPDESFEQLANLQALVDLEILHFPRVSSLEPLAKLRGLRSLRLASLPSWDASYKRLVVESLEPLASLPKLEELHLLGVVPMSRSLSGLESSTSLRFARFHGYTAKEQERFFRSGSVQRAPSVA
jgi:hypothetical protein